MTDKKTRLSYDLSMDKYLLLLAGSCFTCRHFLTFWTSSTDVSLIATFGLSWSWTLAVVASIFSCAIYIFWSRRSKHQSNSGLPYLIGFGLIFIALSLGALAGWINSMEVSIVATLLLGLGNGVSFCIFILAHMREKPGVIIVLLATEFLLGALFYLAIRVAVPNVALVIPALILDLLSWLLLWKCTKINNTSIQTTDEQTIDLKPLAITFRQFCLVTFCFAVSCGIIRTLAIISTGQISIEVTSTLVAAIVLLVLFFVRGMRSSQSFFIIIMGIFAVSFIAIPLYLLNVFIASLIHAFGFSFFLIVCWGLGAYYCKENGLSPVIAVGATYLCVQTGEAVGGGLVLILSPSSELFLYLLSSILLFGLVMLLIMFFVRQQKTKEIDYSAYYNRLNEACARLAKRQGLTQRENEILELVAQRKSNGQIMNKLVISQNTLKTHLRHIYLKLEVHNYSELLDLIDKEVSAS